MNLIKCNSDCRHQKDGYCQLNDVAAVSSTVNNGCVYYQQKEQGKTEHSQSNVR